MSASSAKILQLRIELEHVEPPVWRRVLIKSSSPLSTLHALVQDAMGWWDSHLHQFVKDGEVYGPDWYAEEMDFGETILSERKRLGTLFRTGARWLRYEYDFGDGWTHRVELEKELPFDAREPLPRCIGGERACPPEDCGGPFGYARLLEAISDPRHEEHEELLEWVGDAFDPERFDIAEANARLADRRR